MAEAPRAPQIPPLDTPARHATQQRRLALTDTESNATRHATAAGGDGGLLRLRRGGAPGLRHPDVHIRVGSFFSLSLFNPAPLGESVWHTHTIPTHTPLNNNNTSHHLPQSPFPPPPPKKNTTPPHPTNRTQQPPPITPTPPFPLPTPTPDTQQRLHSS